MTNITAALTAIRPQIAGRYVRMVRAEYDAMVEALGPELKGVYNSWEYARSFRALVAPVLRSSSALDGSSTIDEDRLANLALAYATTATLKWEEKITAKLGDLKDVVIKHFHGCNFLISGTRNGHFVAIDQDVILKRSVRGLLFNQFPARIYVDGKFTSEKKYHEMFK